MLGRYVAEIFNMLGRYAAEIFLLLLFRATLNVFLLSFSI